MRESWREIKHNPTGYLPVFPNWIPYNERLLRDYLKIGGTWVYTRTWELTSFISPLPILLYNSQTTVRTVAKHYEQVFDATKLPRGFIVGYTELIEVRPLNAEEIFFIFGRFNGFTNNEARRVIRKYFSDLDKGRKESELPPYIWPCEIGLFFSEMIRFENPVRYPWRGRKHLAWASLESVSAELEKVNVDPLRVSRLMNKNVP